MGDALQLKEMCCRHAAGLDWKVHPGLRIQESEQHVTVLTLEANSSSTTSVSSPWVTPIHPFTCKFFLCRRDGRTCSL